MARSPSVRYFSSRKAYYCQFRGKQHLLANGPKDEPDGPTYQKAVEEFARIMRLTDGEREGDDTTFSALLGRYKEHLERQGKHVALGMVSGCLDSAVEDFGSVRVRELKNFHAQRWLDRMRLPRGMVRGRVKRWGDTRVRLAAEKLTTALNWAAGQGMISKNPIDLGKLSLPLERSRGRDYVLREGEHARIVTEAHPRFADLLAFLEGTGCRPGEVYHVEARHFDKENQLIRFRWDARPPDYVHKTARRTRKDRVIYLSPELTAMVGRLAEKFSTGSLFRSRFGNRWTNAAVYQGLKRIRGRLKFTGPMIAYSYRHTFATRWLLNGGSIKVLAELLGNSVAMLERHYSHLEVDPASLHRLLVQFRQGATPGAGQQPDVTSQSAVSP